MEDKNVLMMQVEMQNKIIFRQWILILILSIAIVGMFIYECQFEEVVTTTETITQEASSDGSGNISLQNINGDCYGESKADDNKYDNKK